MKEELLKELISNRIKRNEDLNAQVSAIRRRKLEKYLFTELNYAFWLEHNVSAVGIELDKLLIKIEALLKENKGIDETVHFFKLKILNLQQYKHSHIEKLQNCLSELKQKNYFQFFDQLQKLLSQIRLEKPADKEFNEYLAELLTNTSFEKEDIKHLKSLNQTLQWTAIFNGNALGALEDDLKNLQIEMINACYMQEKNVLGAIEYDGAEVVSIKKQLGEQQHNVETYQLLDHDILAFIEEQNFTKNPRRENFRANLKNFCSRHRFNYLTKENYLFMKEYVLKNIPPKQGYFTYEAWRFLYEHVCQYIIQYNEAEWRKPMPPALIVKEKIAAGGNNIAQLVEVHDGYTRSKSDTFILRRSLYGAKPEESVAADDINKLEHPAIAVLYHKAAGKDKLNTELGAEYLRYYSRGRLGWYPLSLDEVPAIFYVIADAVKYLHERNLSHLDLKLANVVMDATGLPVLIDPDSAKKIREKEKTISKKIRNYKKQDTIYTTFAYQSPEFRTVDDHGKLNQRAIDAWALGLMLFQLYTGYFPTLKKNTGEFSGVSELENKRPELFKKDLQDKYIDPRAQEIVNAVTGLLATDPEARVKNYDALMQQDRILGVTKVQAYETFLPKNSTAKLKEQTANLLLDEKIALYEKKISKYEINPPELTDKDKRIAETHIEYYFDCLRETEHDNNKKAQINKCCAIILRDKKINHQRKLDALEEELAELRFQKSWPEKKKILKSKFIGNEKIVDIIDQCLHLLPSLTPNASIQANKHGKLQQELRMLKKQYKSAKPSKRVETLTSIITDKLEELKANKQSRQPYQQLIVASELVNILLSSPDCQTNNDLRKIYRELTVFIITLKKQNPLTAVNAIQANLVETDIDRQEIQVSKDDSDIIDNKHILPMLESWKKITGNYNFFQRIFRRELIKTLTDLGQLLKKIETASLDDKIDLTCQLILKCQAWLDNEKNTSKRLAILKLRNCAIAEINSWLDMKLQKPTEVEAPAAQAGECKAPRQITSDNVSIKALISSKTPKIPKRSSSNSSVHGSVIDVDNLEKVFGVRRSGLK